VNPPNSKNASAVYQDRVLAHARQPVGYTESLDGAASRTVTNPLCGDEVTVMGRWDAGGKLQLGFHCRSCLLCKSSASIMVSSLAGKTKVDAQKLVALFQTSYQSMDPEQATKFQGDLRAIFDLQRYPTRMTCVLLPWDAVSKLLYN